MLDPLSTKAELEARLQRASTVYVEVHREVASLAAEERAIHQKLEAARARLRQASEAEDRARAEWKLVAEQPFFLP